MKEWYHIYKQGNSLVIPIKLSKERPDEWEYNINFFFNGLRHSISLDDITKSYDEELKSTSLNTTIYRGFLKIIFEDKVGFTQ